MHFTCTASLQYEEQSLTKMIFFLKIKIFTQCFVLISLNRKKTFNGFDIVKQIEKNQAGYNMSSTIQKSKDSFFPFYKF